MARTWSSPPRSAFYYPFPVFQDENWLKEQALFWDGLYRIVPIGFEGMSLDRRPRRPNRTQRALTSDGFVHDLTVDQEDLKTVAGQFLDLAEVSPWFAQQSRQDGREYFSWDNVDGDKTSGDERSFRLPPTLAELIYERPGTWRFFPGKVYMALLAKHLSATRGLPVVTDDAEHDVILKAEDLFRRTQSDEGSPEYVALLYAIILERLGFPDIADVPVGRILKFRHRYEDERKAFADRVEGIAASLKGRAVSGHAEVQEILRDHAAKLDLARRDLAAALRGNRIETTLKAAAGSVPVITAAATGGLPTAVSSAGGALGIGALLYGSRRSRRVDLVKDRSAAYLFAMDNKLNTSLLLQRFRSLGADLR
jgi:hypothetical protein